MKKNTNIRRTSPIKWVGGKAQLSKTITNMLPSYNRYIEPFIGGGAIFFSLSPKNAIINDANKQLTTMYRCLRDHLEETETELLKMQLHYNALPSLVEKKAYYMILRSRFNTCIAEDIHTPETASLFIFLNKTGFNGLYRTNKSGQFNVPFGKNEKVNAFTHEDLLRFSEALANTTILTGDYAAACQKAKAGDFIFFDPPYDNTFTDYQAGGFDRTAQIKLRDLFGELTKRGVKCMLTNSDTNFMKSIYKDFTVTTVRVKRSINTKSKSKDTTNEIIVTNYAA